MTPLEQFDRSDVLRIVGITAGQLNYWERLRLLAPARTPAHPRKRTYTFGDLTRLRSLKQLTARVPARRLRAALEAFRRHWPDDVQTALTAAHFTAAGRWVAVDYRGSLMEPVSGQYLLPLHGGAAEAKVRAMPERSLEDWLAIAQECERDPGLRRRAIDAYRKIVEKAPAWLEPKLNLGTLLYEDGDLRAAAQEFRRAVDASPGNPLAHFNLASVLDDLGEPEFAAQHFETALQLAPEFADAHYNLARVYEKLGAAAAACEHWRRYLDFDPQSEWSAHARQRLTALAAAGDPACRASLP